MYLEKFVQSQTGRYLMSILLGVGLATMFREVCKGRNCKIIKAPPLEEIEDKIYKFDNKCYKINKQAIKCDTKKNTVVFA
jgi:hypothetical protein